MALTSHFLSSVIDYIFCFISLNLDLPSVFNIFKSFVVVQSLRHVWLFVPHGLKHTCPSPSCPSLSPWVCSNSCPLIWWYHPTSSSSVIPFSSCLHLSQHQDLFQWVSSSHQVAKVLALQLQHQSFQWIFRADFLKIDWFDLLAVQGPLKNLLQHDKLVFECWYWITYSWNLTMLNKILWAYALQVLFESPVKLVILSSGEEL